MNASYYPIRIAVQTSEYIRKSAGTGYVKKLEKL